MHLENHIRFLLQENNCVVVPGLGGFLTHYQPARLIKTRQVITAPSKKIAFNEALQASDGLLINHIAKINGYTYAEAEEQVSKQVAGWREMLQNEGKVYLQEIGTCTLNDEGNIYFLPDPKAPNLLLDSFGMEEVEAIPVERQKTDISQHLQNAATIEAPTGDRKRKWGWAMAAAIIFIGFFLLVGGYLIFTKPDIQENLSGFFTGRTNDTEGAIQDEQPSTEESRPIISDAPEPQPDNRIVNDETLSDEPQMTGLENSDPLVDEPDLLTETAPVLEEDVYYIIGGSFSRQRNAEKLVRSLERKGYTPGIINTDFGHFRVSITKTSKAKEADSLLSIIRQKENSSAWILIN